MSAALLLCALGAAPAQFVWPKPGLVDETPIDEVIRADGVPVRLHTFRSTAGIQELLQTYATAFDKAGFYVALQQKRVVAEPHITALDPRTKISYSAILSPNKDGTTTCLLGEAALGKARAPPADFAPLMPNAQQILRTDQETDRLISFTVAAPSEAVHRFYRAALPDAGYGLPEADAPNAYVKGNERIQVMVTPKPSGVTAVVLMHRR